MKYLVQYCSLYDNRFWHDYRVYFTRFFALRVIAKKIIDPLNVDKWRLIKVGIKPKDFILYEFERKKIFKYR